VPEDQQAVPSVCDDFVRKKQKGGKGYGKGQKEKLNK
jgi:hypothetical protein